MIISATGHRPDKIGGYSNRNLERLVSIASKWLEENKPEGVITGGALGWDTAVAIASIRLGIKLTLAIPCTGQESQWPQKSKEVYQRILKKANNVVNVNDGPYEHWKMQARNEWMVDNSHTLLAFWNGKVGGGTYNCIIYGRNQGIQIINLYENQ